MAHTGQSEAIHSPDECANTVVRLMRSALWSIAVVCTVAISCSPIQIMTGSVATSAKPRATGSNDLGKTSTSVRKLLNVHHKKHFGMDGAQYVEVAGDGEHDRCYGSWPLVAGIE